MAVAAGLATFAIGSDTGGSIRIPAALCGIVGLKPTFGRVSLHGILPNSSSFDTVGPMTRSVQDAALVLAAIAGPDPHDLHTLLAPVQTIPTELVGELRGTRLAIPREMLSGQLHPQVKARFEDAVAVLAEHGAQLEEIHIPELAASVELALTIARPEAYSFDRDIVGEDWEKVAPLQRETLLRARETPAYAYVAALRRLRELRPQVHERMKPYHALIFPTTLLPSVNENVYFRSGIAYSELTRPVNAFGLCAVTVPCGFSTDGLPVGLQVVGKPFDEAAVLEIAFGYEQRTDWHRKRPPLDTGVTTSCR